MLTAWSPPFRPRGAVYILAPRVEAGRNKSSAGYNAQVVRCSVEPASVRPSTLTFTSPSSSRDSPRLQLPPTEMASSAFRAVCLLLVSLAMCQVVAVQGLSQVAEDINKVFGEVTTMSNDLKLEVQQITGPISIVTGGFKIAAGFGRITFKVSAAVSMLAGMPETALEAADAKTVVVALTTFVRVHQALLNVVIGKAGLLSKVPVLNPVRQALVSLEQVVDEFAFFLIALIPTEEKAATTQFMALTVTVQMAQKAYEPVFGIPGLP